MKTIKSLYYWTVGLLTVGMMLFGVIIFSYFLPPHRYDDRWIKKMSRLLFKLLHSRVIVEGSEKIERNKTYLFMANHVSLFDVPLLAGYIPTFVRAVEAERQHRWLVYGWAVKRYGNISIKRESHHGSIKSIRKAEKVLRSGQSVVILPEGHRTLDGRLRPFKKLPFFLAKQAETPIVPIGLSGLFEMKRKGSWHIHPTTLKIKFGDIIPADVVRHMSPVELRDLTRERIQALIERP